MSNFAQLASLVLVLASVACIHAARFPTYGSVGLVDLPESVVAFQNGKQESPTTNTIDSAFLGSPLYYDLEALVADPELTRKEKWPIHIVTKFMVKPDLHINFLHKYWSYSEASCEHKGIVHLSLNKVAGDNIVWTLYTVYKDVHALFEHIKSEAVRDFGSFIMYENIAVEYKVLLKIGGCHHSNGNGCFEPNTPATTTDDNKKGGKHREWALKLVTTYIVPPPVAHEFIEEWERLESKLSKAEGNPSLALFKPADDNLVFVGFSAWESYEDFWAAGKKKATEEFIDFLEDRGIVLIARKIWGVPNRHP